MSKSTLINPFGNLHLIEKIAKKVVFLEKMNSKIFYPQLLFKK